MANLQLGIAGALDQCPRRSLPVRDWSSGQGVTGAVTASAERAELHIARCSRSGLRRKPAAGPFCMFRPARAFTSALARAGSIEPAWRSFTRAMTRPMSFIDDAPVSAMIACDGGAASASLHLRGQEALDHRDLGLFGGRQFLAVALAIDVDRFAALLDHFLQHLGHQRIVVRRWRRGAQFDVAVLDRRLDQRGSSPSPALSPPFIARTSAALMSSRIIALVSLHRKGQS